MKKLMILAMLALTNVAAGCVPGDDTDEDLDAELEDDDSDIQGKHRWRNHVVVYAGDTFEAVIEDGETSRVIGEYDSYNEAEAAGRDAAKAANKGFMPGPGCVPPVLC